MSGKGYRGTKTKPAVYKGNRKGYLFAWFDHVHTPDGYCIKNRFGFKCEKVNNRNNRDEIL